MLIYYFVKCEIKINTILHSVIEPPFYCHYDCHHDPLAPTLLPLTCHLV